MNNSLFPELPELSANNTKFSRKSLTYLLVAAGILVILVLPALLGRSSGTSGDVDSTDDPDEIAEKEEQRLLEDVVTSIQPERLGVEIDEATVAQELNRWWIEYGPGREQNSTFADTHREPLQSLLGDDASILALDDVFARRDVAHMATALTLRLAGLKITTGLTSDVEKVSALFYFVVRNIQIDSDTSSWSGVFPGQTLLWGRGRTEDRVWAFAELLRQMRFDSFVLLPAEGEDSHPLLAVHVEDELLLYDPVIGFPIPSLMTESNETALPEHPASFTEALENDQVFRQLDGVDSAYPWSSEDLSHVRFLVVGTDSTFSPRMEALQHVLPSQFSFAVYDGWASTELRESPLQSRLDAITAGMPEVKAEFGTWTYPLTQAATYDHDNGLDGEFLSEREVWFQAPTILERLVQEDKTVVERHRPATRNIQVVRSMHIEGEFEEAMKGYLPMRNAYLQNAVSENRVAAEYAVFWSALCQFEFGRTDLAASGFRDYLREYGTGQFARSANYWLAVSLADNGDLPAALEALKSPVLTTLPAGHIEYLTKRWSGFQSVPTTTPDEAASLEPVDETVEPADTESEVDATPDDPSASGDEP